MKLASVAVAIFYLLAVLTPPEIWLDGGWLPTVAAEAVLMSAVLLLLSALGRHPGRRSLGFLAALVLVLTVLSIGDTVVRRGFGRPLDLPVDFHLAPALFEFVADAMGGSGWVWVPGAVLFVIVLYCCNRAALRSVSSAPRMRGGLLAVFGVIAAVALARVLLEPAVACAPGYAVSCYPSRVAAHQVESGIALWRPMPEFDAALSDDRLDGFPDPLFTRLGGTDVLLVFVESYGASALHDPRYASEIVPQLTEIETRLRGADLVVASGMLEAPTVGGLSWLSHGTMLSGLWLDSQRRYDRLVVSDRRSLTHLFQDAGYRTAGIFPQLLRPWPEGRYFGYDRLWTSQNIEYHGPRFGWTTMPDQYTLWFLQQERERSVGRSPLFAEVALISSHAPWEPVPPLVDDWQSLGTGEPFRGTVEEEWDGPRNWPAEASRNYGRSIGYSLEAVAGFARRFVDDRTILIVLGDHQPAPLITGPEAGRSVPVHVVTGDPDLVRPFLEWGFDPSMVPDTDGTARRMDSFRDWFVAAFSDGDLLTTMPQRPD